MLTLRQLMDEKVEDVYEENAHFDSLLQVYYKTHDSSLLREMWPIMFRCACNVLKRRFGTFKDSDWIIDKALTICEIIFGRINNFEKYPTGYVITNLPTCVRFAVLNAVYPNKDPDRHETPYEELPVKSDQEQFSTWQDNFWQGNTWEDELISRIDSSF